MERLKLAKKQCSYYKKRFSAVSKSRACWKDKNKDNPWYTSLQGRQQKIKHLKSQLDRSSRIKRHHYPAFVIMLCVFLRIKAGCSYRGIVKVLQVLRFCCLGWIEGLPCANSVQNWVSKVGLYALSIEDKGLKNTEVSLILDESIRLGQEKQLLILSVPWHKQGKSALDFEGVQVLHIQGAKSWTGEKIAAQIEDLVEKHGFILKNLLSDEDSKLKKAARLSEVVHLPDIAHAVATSLRKTFEKVPDYKAFTTLVAGYKSKGVNQELSYLTPPQQRAKVRFMNQSPVVHWAKKMLGGLNHLGEKAQKFFVQLPQHAPLIDQLSSALSLAKSLSFSFKTAGLSPKTLEKAQKIADKPPQDQDLVATFLSHIKTYLKQYEQILTEVGDFAIHASSEIIESFFGKYKAKAHQYALTGVTKLNLEVPLYAMTSRELKRKIPLALQDITMTQLDLWIKTHASESQLVKRTKFFKKKT